MGKNLCKAFFFGKLIKSSNIFFIYCFCLTSAWISCKKLKRISSNVFSFIKHIYISL